MKLRRLGRPKVVVGTLVTLLALIGIAAGVILFDNRADAPKATTVAVAKRSAPAAPSSAPAPSAPFDKSRMSTSNASSLWVIVNKQHPLSPIDYNPSDLVGAYGHQVSSRMVFDLTALVNAAGQDGANLTVISSFRSYSYQVNLYNSYVASDGQAKADTYSARPGYSEHQTGLAIDFGNKAGTCPVEACYADTIEGKWLAANAYKYGFLLRYTAEKQSVTGYEAEAWHYRYVGKDLALEMHTQNITTLEEFFGVSGGETYN